MMTNQSAMFSMTSQLLLQPPIRHQHPLQRPVSPSVARSDSLALALNPTCHVVGCLSADNCSMPLHRLSMARVQMAQASRLAQHEHPDHRKIYEA